MLMLLLGFVEVIVDRYREDIIQRFFTESEVSASLPAISITRSSRQRPQHDQRIRGQSIPTDALGVGKGGRTMVVG